MNNKIINEIAPIDENGLTNDTNDRNSAETTTTTKLALYTLSQIDEIGGTRKAVCSR